MKTKVKMMTKFQRWRLVRKLQRLVRKYDRAIEHFDCGQQIAEHISPDLHVLRIKYEAIFDRLRAAEKQKSAAAS